MEDFNPITDLQQNEDKFNVPAGTSTPEIEDIRERLVDTRNKTAELVKVVKKHNPLFKKDIDKIKFLNKRLYKTIPRIPAMRGVASSEFGSELKDEDKKARLQLDFFRTFKSRTLVSAPVKQRLPILETIIFLILTRGRGKGKQRVTTNFSDNARRTTFSEKDAIKILESIFKKKIIKKQPAKVINKTNRRVNPEDGGFFARRRKTKNKPKTFDKEQQKKLRREIDKDVNTEFLKTETGAFNNFLRKNNLPVPKNLFRRVEELSESFRRDFLTLRDNGKITQRQFERRMQEITDRSIVTNNEISAYEMLVRKYAKIIREGGKVDPKDLKKIKDLDLFKFKSPEFKGKEGTIDPRTLNEEILQNRFRKFDEILEELIFKEPISSLNAKPFSSDIASLNIDTGITNTVIIITDTPPPTTA